jgi:hypothetical protein
MHLAGLRQCGRSTRTKCFAALARLVPDAIDADRYAPSDDPCIGPAPKGDAIDHSAGFLPSRLQKRVRRGPRISNERFELGARSLTKEGSHAAAEFCQQLYPDDPRSA